MKKLAITIAFILSYIILFAQTEDSCLPEGITFTTQEEIDSFQINYPGCTEIEGNLSIGINGGTNITNLNGLNILSSIGGDLIIAGNDILINLTGLENLTVIGGSLWIGDDNFEGNASLINLNGLDNLASIGNNINIWGNIALTSLTGLDNLTLIPGSLYIAGNTALNSLAGLDNITVIGNDLQFGTEANGFPIGNPALNSLSGLDNMTSIGGSLRIFHCINLTSLTGLESLTSIGDHLHLYNTGLTSLSGLDNVSSVGFNLTINGNDALTSLTGLPNVTIMGNLLIEFNSNLTSLSGLDNITSVGGNLKINNNDALTSLTGFNNFTSISGDLIITGNPQLCNCSVDALCTYLSNPNGGIYFSNNGVGCSSMIEVAIACGTALPCLEVGWYSMFSQFDVDHFPAVFPGCNNLNCNVRIDGNDITNLDSLANVTSIEGDLVIYTNYALTNLTGLDNLNSIGGYLTIWGNTLTNLSGLGSVNSIGGSVEIKYNNDLTSLIGLYNLTSIGNDIVVWQNSSLTRLTGLDNIDAGSINDLDIRGNEQLSTCEVQSICNYLVSPNGNILIQNNAPGCNSQQEVAGACDSITSVNNEIKKPDLSILPNPVNNHAVISLNIHTKNSVEIYIYNTTGICIKNWQYPNQQTGQKEYMLDLKDLQGGIYFCRVKVGSEMVTKKIIKL
jgi:acyl-[acyl carrier protein]--UDP-N-acetylglucosamine O-acyltransferase